jgi:hypothetical protein
MRRYAVAFLTLAATLMAANLKLYLKDGDYQIVREYKVDGDRVLYYSVERSDWEEMPAALVDLKKTQAEASAKKEKIDKQAKEISEEDEARREQRKEILKIPTDPGVYRVVNDELEIFKQADMIMHNNKGRNVWKALSPIPMVAGKATVEVAGEHSSMVLRGDPRPEFYMQLSLQDSLAMVKLTPGKDGVRIVERIRIEPVVNTITEERDAVQVFTKQLTESGLYKIWPQESLEKGEYALIEYDEGKANPRIWDFRIE